MNNALLVDKIISDPYKYIVAASVAPEKLASSATWFAIGKICERYFGTVNTESIKTGISAILSIL